VVITKGIAAMDDLDGLYAKVRAFNDFTERNDPYGEHDFGSVEHGEDNQLIFWKFDYWDLDLAGCSPDPSDPAVCHRALTIMLAEEY
jgi:hypothetical protein